MPLPEDRPATRSVYVPLLGEGTEVYRPVEAIWQRDDVFEIVSKNLDPEDEHWLFSTGDLIRCRERTFSGGESGLVAFERVGQPSKRNNATTQALSLGAKSPKELLACLLDHGASDRQLRLFACACCRRVWHLLPDDGSRRAVELAERFADGLADQEELAPVERAVRTAARAMQIAFGSESDAWKTAKAAEITVRRIVLPPTSVLRGLIDRSDIARLLGDIFDATFCPIRVDPSWRTPAVVALAEAASEERELPGGHLAPSLLGILADALEDGGCTDPRLLTHLRDPGPHARGCWAVDAITGRE